MFRSATAALESAHIQGEYDTNVHTAQRVRENTNARASEIRMIAAFSELSESLRNVRTGCYLPMPAVMPRTKKRWPAR